MKTHKPLIILGSARKDSDTGKTIARLFADMDTEQIDLLDYIVYPYNYSADYPADDNFISIIERLLQHDVIVFATPVYWYAMSGLMKMFFDRFTDLVTVRKDLGRQLKGIKIFLIAVGADKDVPDGFEVPFRRTSEYLDMQFVSSYYHDRNSLGSKQADRSDIMDEILTAVQKA